MPLELREVKNPDGRYRLLVGADQLPRAGVARRSEEPAISAPTRFSICCISEQQLAQGNSRTSIRRSSGTRSCSSGTSASGLHDVFETPFAGGRMPGIQLHASVADDFLSNRFMRSRVESCPNRARHGPGSGRRGAFRGSAGVVGRRGVRCRHVGARLRGDFGCSPTGTGSTSPSRRLRLRSRCSAAWAINTSSKGARSGR